MRQFLQNLTRFSKHDVVERPEFSSMAADISDASRQPPVRVARKCWMITAAGSNTVGARYLQTLHSCIPDRPAHKHIGFVGAAGPAGLIIAIPPAGTATRDLQCAVRGKLSSIPVPITPVGKAELSCIYSFSSPCCSGAGLFCVST